MKHTPKTAPRAHAAANESIVRVFDVACDMEVENEGLRATLEQILTIAALDYSDSCNRINLIAEEALRP